MSSNSAPWLVAVARLPAEPSRHRVAVWRELRRAGAMSLGGGAWILPSGPMTDEAMVQVRVLVERAEGGELLLLDSTATDDSSRAKLEADYTVGVEAEWIEYLADCDKYSAELEREIRIEKFTLAELEEEEQSLERLRRWHRALQLRDRFGAGSALRAAARLAECSAQLDHYADLVYKALGQ